MILLMQNSPFVSQHSVKIYIMKIVNILDSGHLNHPFEVWREDSVLDEPAGQIVPLIWVGTID